MSAFDRCGGVDGERLGPLRPSADLEVVDAYKISRRAVGAGERPPRRIDVDDFPLPVQRSDFDGQEVEDLTQSFTARRRFRHWNGRFPEVADQVNLYRRPKG